MSDKKTNDEDLINELWNSLDISSLSNLEENETIAQSNKSAIDINNNEEPLFTDYNFSKTNNTINQPSIPINNISKIKRGRKPNKEKENLGICEKSKNIKKTHKQYGNKLVPIEDEISIQEHDKQRNINTINSRINSDFDEKKLFDEIEENLKKIQNIKKYFEQLNDQIFGSDSNQITNKVPSTKVINI
jgi:hypothetical protein